MGVQAVELAVAVPVQVLEVARTDAVALVQVVGPDLRKRQKES